MLTPAKKRKLAAALQAYRKRYLIKKYKELDESGTRLMINAFLENVLGYLSIEEIRTEYMIRGTYADYVIQIGGKRYFLVEVKALPIELSAKHLRQAVNYGANEGIDWALLTNGRHFEFYRILFNKPIESRRIFSIDLADAKQADEHVEFLQYLHKASVLKKGLDALWNKSQALDAYSIAGILHSKPVINFLRRELKKKYNSKLSEAEVIEALRNALTSNIDMEKVKPPRARRGRKNSASS